MKVFLDAIIFHTLLNGYVFFRGWKILPHKKAWHIAFSTLFILELCIYLIGFIFWENLPYSVLRFSMYIGSTWMVFVIYMSMFLIISDIVWIISFLFGNFGKRFHKDGFNIRRVYYIISVLFVILLMVRGSYRFWHPDVSEYSIQVDKTTPNVKHLRIAMASDLHIGYMIDRNILAMYVDKIMEQKPDIILLGGDLIDYDLPYLQHQQMGEEFKRLHAPFGVYAVPGNHEYRLNWKDKIDWLEKDAGLTLLRDSVVLIDRSFYLIGRDDYKTALTRESLDHLLANVDRSLPMIVLDHQPYPYGERKESVDLAIYGHTHNGQLFPVNLYVKTLYMVSYGYKKMDRTNVFVSSGLGLAGPQYRIGTQSEVMVINVTFDK